MLRGTSILISTTAALIIVKAANANDPYGDDYLPDYYKTQTSSSLLCDSLRSEDYMVRKLSAIRLGQIGDRSSLSALKEAYDNEPLMNIEDGGFSTKYQCLISIGKIGGSGADSILTAIARKMLAPEIARENKQFFGDSLDLFFGTFYGLVEIGNPESDSIFMNVFNSNLDVNLREIAYKAHLKLTLKRSSLSTVQDSLYYLLNGLKDAMSEANYPEEDPDSGVKIKARALRYLIFNYSKKDPSILDYYKSQLEPGDPFVEELHKIFEQVESQLRLERQLKARKAE